MGQPSPANRHDIEVFLTTAVASSRRSRRPLSLLVIDVDHCMQLIETHGRSAGEQVIRSLARLLDDRHEWSWRRSGPDEFLVVLPDTDETQAARLAEGVRGDVSSLDLPWQPLTVSVGVAGTSETRATADQLEAHARNALRRAKVQGRDRVERASTSPAPSEEGDISSGSPARGGPVGVVVLSAEQRPPVRRVFELSGLTVLESGTLEELDLSELGSDHPALYVTEIGGLDELEPWLEEWSRVAGDAPAAAVAFVGDAPEEERLPVHPRVTLLAGRPSAASLLPLVSGLLAEARQAGEHRVPAIEGGFGSRLASADAPPTVGNILIVDDDYASRAALERALRAIGFANLRAVEGGEEALSAVADDPPDLVLLDLDMPRMDGFAVLEALAPLLEGDGFLPVLVVTGDQEREHRQRALSSGAKDFLHKPFDVSELGARVLNLLETRKLHLRSRGTSQLLEARVRERTQELGVAKDEIIFRLARAAEYRDDQTGRHAARVAAASAVLAAAMGLDAERCELLRRAAPLHDVGKIGIPDAILLKPGALDDEEMVVMRQHTVIGADLLSRSTSAVIEEARVIAIAHHERWDGGGYPHGLRGSEIPIQGRIVALADALDALTHERPYKPAYPFDESARRLIVEAGSAFDPEVTAALESAAFRIRDILIDDDEASGPW